MQWTHAQVLGDQIAVLALEIRPPKTLRRRGVAVVVEIVFVGVHSRAFLGIRCTATRGRRGTASGSGPAAGGTVEAVVLAHRTLRGRDALLEDRAVVVGATTLGDADMRNLSSTPT